MHLGRFVKTAAVAILLTTCLTCFSLREVSAADEGKAASHDTAEQEKDDVFKGWLDLSIWTIVVFLVLLFVLGKYAWKPMLQGLEQREHSIQSAMEEAKKAR